MLNPERTDSVYTDLTEVEAPRFYIGTETCNCLTFFKNYPAKAITNSALSGEIVLLSPPHIQQNELQGWEMMIWDLVSSYGFEVIVNDMGLLNYLISEGWDRVAIGRVLSPLFLNQTGIEWLKSKNINRIGIERGHLGKSQDKALGSCLTGIRISLYADTAFMALANHCSHKGRCETCCQTFESSVNDRTLSLVRMQKALLQRMKFNPDWETFSFRRNNKTIIDNLIDRIVLYGDF